MSQFLNLKFDEDSNDKLSPYGEKKDEGSDESIILADGPTRNICFVIDNTRKVFLNYSYLISGEYLPEENKVILTFTTHEVTLEGIRMKLFFYQIMENQVKQVSCIDGRYNEIAKVKETILNKIIISVNS